MFKRTILSRLAQFTALHGINQKENDYLSIIKNQGEEGLCWAYALTSAIEMNYARKTGNRLMLDPMTLKNRSVPWWNKQNQTMKKENEHCLQYSDEGYSVQCAAQYMAESGDTMIQKDGQDSFVKMSDGGTIEIKSLRDLFDTLDEHGILYSGIDADKLDLQTPITTEYYETTVNNHAIVITAVGKISNIGDDDGIYVEILNSWGYSYGYDGLFYVKVANSESSSLVNNMNMFEANIWIEVERKIKQETPATIIIKNKGAKACAITFGILFFITLIAFIALFIIIWKYPRWLKFSDPLSESSYTQA